MEARFRRLTPHRNNLVEDVNKEDIGPIYTVLCVECGWELRTDYPMQHFMAHSCRLITESVSVGD